MALSDGASMASPSPSSTSTNHDQYQPTNDHNGHDESGGGGMMMAKRLSSSTSNAPTNPRSSQGAGMHAWTHDNSTHAGTSSDTNLMGNGNGSGMVHATQLLSDVPHGDGVSAVNIPLSTLAEASRTAAATTTTGEATSSPTDNGNGSNHMNGKSSRIINPSVTTITVTPNDSNGNNSNGGTPSAPTAAPSSASSPSRKNGAVGSPSKRKKVIKPPRPLRRVCYHIYIYIYMYFSYNSLCI